MLINGKSSSALTEMLQWLNKTHKNLFSGININWVSKAMLWDLTVTTRSLAKSGVSVKATTLEFDSNTLIFCIICVNSKHYLRTTLSTLNVIFVQLCFQVRSISLLTQHDSRPPCSLTWNNVTASKLTSLLPYFPSPSIPHIPCLTEQPEWSFWNINHFPA